MSCEKQFYEYDSDPHVECLEKEIEHLRDELQWIAESYSLDERETTYRARVLILRAKKALQAET